MFALLAGRRSPSDCCSRGRRRPAFGCVAVCGLLAVLALRFPPAAHGRDDTPPPTPGATAPDAAHPRPAARRVLLRGRVVFVRDALNELGISASEELDGQVALKTDDGELLPITPDWRGRAFFQDARLRNRPVELVVRRHAKIPYLQVLMVFVLEGDKRLYMDYWCDVCSIPAYELKPCACCQGPLRLRLTPRPLPEYLATPSDAPHGSGDPDSAPATP